ncbi:hypothetical protein C8R48DRAFT_779648 [Suillus tomentosus]|nr:hypothetical protein C8R48DRAFT_779648 [Suillus tomentosus]
MPQAGDSSDDFMAELNAVEDAESESGSNEQGDESDTRSDLSTLRTILMIPQPDVPMHKVHRFCAAVSSERSNILHSLKDCTGLIFSSLKLDPTVFTDEPAKKKENGQLLALLKKEVCGEKYTHLALILFMNPSAVVPNDFLKTLVMGSRSSMLKYLGRHRYLGRQKDIQRPEVSVGLCNASQKACFLLTHDQELTVTGPATKIEYGQNFDFYLEQLFKRSPWAVSVINYYNKEVFGTSLVPATTSASSISASQSRTWEDDFLQQLEDPASAPQAASVPVPQFPNPSSHITYAPTFVSRADVNAVATVDYQTAMSISSQGGVQAPITTTQLQFEVGIGQLSLDDAGSNLAPSVSNGSEIDSDSDSTVAVPLAPLPAAKHVTCKGGVGRMKKLGKK